MILINFVNRAYNNICNYLDNRNHMASLPDELLLEIFSYLNLASLASTALVCKEWKRLTKDPSLWKIAIYREIAFGNDKWARCFGKDALKDEDGKEEFDSLPWSEFIADCKKFKNLFPEKKARDCLMLVRLPKTLSGGLTLKSLGRLSKKYFLKSHTGYRVIWYNVLTELGDKSLDKSRWVLMTKDILPGSRNKSYAEQQKIVAHLAEKSLMGYEVPGTLEAAACILSDYFDSNMRLFSDKPLTYTHCKDNIQSYPTIVGGFSPDGLFIFESYADKDSIGMAALKKF